MLLLLSAEIFNQTVEENDEDIKAMAIKYAGPVVAVLGGIGAAWQSLFGGKGVISGLVGVSPFFSTAGLLYGFEEDGFGFNEESGDVHQHARRGSHPHLLVRRRTDPYGA